MKRIVFILMMAFQLKSAFAQQPKIIADGTITFSINSSDSTENNLGSKVIYLKGKDVRVDLTSSRFSQTIFNNGKDGNVTVLKTIGQSKYISYYTAEEWKKQNEIYNGITTSFTNNTKTVLDYTCKEAVLKLKNGITYTVYYLPTYIFTVSENPFEFKDIPGIVLEYQASTKNGKSVIYKAEKVDFTPVPSMQFEIPTKGYRVLDEKD